MAVDLGEASLSGLLEVMWAKKTGYVNPVYMVIAPELYRDMCRVAFPWKGRRAVWLRRKRHAC